MSRSWIKLHTDMLAHPGTGRLSDVAFRAWITMLLMAGKRDEDGVVGDIHDVAWQMRLPTDLVEDALRELNGRVASTDGILAVRDWHDWQPPQRKPEPPDQVTERKRRQRERDDVGHADVTQMSRSVTDVGHADVTQPRVRERREEKREETASRANDGREQPRRPLFDVFCQVWGFDPTKPTSGIRGLAGEFDARCSRLEPAPGPEDVLLWVDSEKLRLVNGVPAWGTVTKKHTAADGFIGWWQVHHRSRRNGRPIKASELA